MIISKELQKYIPASCPSCQSGLIYDGIHLTCSNENCVGKTAKKLSAATGILDLKNVGGKTIEPFAQDFSTMYDVMYWIITSHDKPYFSLEKYGIKKGSRSEEIFVNAFLNIKSLKYSQVILLMGYDKVGRKLSEQVARQYCGLEPDYTSMERALVAIFQKEEVESFIKFAVSELENAGIKIDRPVNKANNDTIFVCMTGSPKAFGFKTKEEWIKQFPNVKEASLSDKNCKFLITDSYESTSGKMKEANKKGIQIKTYGDFKI